MSLVHLFWWSQASAKCTDSKVGLGKLGCSICGDDGIICAPKEVLDNYDDLMAQCSWLPSSKDKHHRSDNGFVFLERFYNSRLVYKVVETVTKKLPQSQRLEKIAYAPRNNYKEVTSTSKRKYRKVQAVSKVETIRAPACKLTSEISSIPLAGFVYPEFEEHVEV